ncbi:3-oxoadipate enol-lactonase [Granulosicoccus antarcticus]|uniref:3-oxoadipate enol-lactonase 2 n=1 Tax=Granulosicoccus antarcticus IMCC3135 TaxID=1192854 RepID=A0A2Z2NT34_9GAMM|nr:3-oxoadipate enol-lactonase [Granulosicoccus antarcticus]ASJ73201.1 3-oxoadipate enol-lactonase 2 [Granulosicoccus antarcticus IMCC3135]
MKVLKANGIAMHWREDGNPDGMPVIFANSLGTDLRMWDELLPLLPKEYRYLRYDVRGHGLTQASDGPYSMELLTADAGALIDELQVGPVIFVGLSIGGMIGQGLAASRPDLVKALVLSNTAARMGTAEMWDARIAQIMQGGIEGSADAILDRWFGAEFRESPQISAWRAMLTRTPQAGYLGCCAALADADLSASTGTLRLPTLGIAGSEDGASPPDLVAATCKLIEGAACHVISGAGHLPCVEKPCDYAAILSPFLKEHANA